MCLGAVSAFGEGCGGVRAGREAPGARGPIAGPRVGGEAALEPVWKVLTHRDDPGRGAPYGAIWALKRSGPQAVFGRSERGALAVNRGGVARAMRPIIPRSGLLRHGRFEGPSRITGVGTMTAPSP